MFTYEGDISETEGADVSIHALVLQRDQADPRLSELAAQNGEDLMLTHTGVTHWGSGSGTNAEVHGRHGFIWFQL